MCFGRADARCDCVVEHILRDWQGGPFESFHYLMCAVESSWSERFETKRFFCCNRYIYFGESNIKIVVCCAAQIIIFYRLLTGEVNIDDLCFHSNRSLRLSLLLQKIAKCFAKDRLKLSV